MLNRQENQERETKENQANNNQEASISFGSFSVDDLQADVYDIVGISWEYNC